MRTEWTPKAWFDQFINYLAEHPEVSGSEQWCARHWAPCPAFGANGVGASAELMAMWASNLPKGLSAKELNERMRHAGKLCCALGDEKMYDLWGRWGPSAEHAS